MSVAHPTSYEHHTQGTQDPFVVRQPCFTGTLSELAHALLSANLKPSDIDLLGLVRSYLEYYRRHADNLDLASETLPNVARIIELKARLLLPRAAASDLEETETEAAGETLAAVIMLDELDDAIRFLRQRREQRRLILPARAERPAYERPKRPLNVAVGRLAQLASRCHGASYFEVAAKGLTMMSAIEHAYKVLRQRRRGRLTDLLPVPSWEGLVMTFAGLLELIRQGKVRACQQRPFGPIEVELEVERQIREVA